MKSRGKIINLMGLVLLWVGFAEAKPRGKSLKEYKGTDLYEEFGILTEGREDNMSANENMRLGSINGSYNIFKERLFAEGTHNFILNL